MKFTKHVISTPRIEESQCTKWIEKPAFLHVSNAVHIYFKFLNLYNIHKAIHDEGLSDGDYFVVRLGNLENDKLNYTHAEFEERLFQGYRHNILFSLRSETAFRWSALFLIIRA